MNLTTGRAVLLLLIIQSSVIKGIIEYDCGSPSANLTMLSLLNIKECNIPRTETTTKRIYVQLLQTNEFDLVKVYQCKVEIDRLIKRCGMFSHTSDVLNGKHSYIGEVVRNTCLHMHMYGTYQLGGTTISGLRPNQTTTRPVTLAGIVEVDGTCSGTAYTDPYGAWDKVVVLASVKITLTDYMANVRINAGYMAMLAGEVIHIVKCVPVEVKIAAADKCFTQLPVLKDNNTYYLTPQIHILLRQSTQIPCNALAPSMYLLGNSWYKFTPRPEDTLPPTMMRPVTKPTWKYINPGSLATSGIYTQDDLKGLRDHIMFPAE